MRKLILLSLVLAGCNAPPSDPEKHYEYVIVLNNVEYVCSDYSYSSHYSYLTDCTESATGLHIDRIFKVRNVFQIAKAPK